MVFKWMVIKKKQRAFPDVWMVVKTVYYESLLKSTWNQNLDVHLLRLDRCLKKRQMVTVKFSSTHPSWSKLKKNILFSLITAWIENEDFFSFLLALLRLKHFSVYAPKSRPICFYFFLKAIFFFCCCAVRMFGRKIPPRPLRRKMRQPWWSEMRRSTWRCWINARTITAPPLKATLCSLYGGS